MNLKKVCHLRNWYQSLLRRKKSDFHLTKTMSDFKNAKNFYQFYSTSIKTKKSKSSSSCVDSLVVDGRLIEDSEEISDQFNKHFTSIGGSITNPISKVESSKFIN